MTLTALDPDRTAAIRRKYGGPVRLSVHERAARKLEAELYSLELAEAEQYLPPPDQFTQGEPVKTFSIEIEHIKTGERKAMPVPGCGWTEDSPHYYATRMCDCNLAGYFKAELIPHKNGVRQTPHQIGAGIFIEQHGCDHTMPPKHFKATRALLDNGEVVAL